MVQESRKNYRLFTSNKRFGSRHDPTYWGWAASSSWWYCWSSSWALFQLFATWQLMFLELAHLVVIEWLYNKGTQGVPIQQQWWVMNAVFFRIYPNTRNKDSNGTRESIYFVSLCLIKYSPQLLHQRESIMRFFYSPFLQWSIKEISFIQSGSENKQVPYPYRPPDRFTRSFARIQKSIQPSSHRRSWSSSNYRNLRFKFSSSCHPQILWFKEISQKMWMMVWWNRLRWVVVLTGSMCMSWMLGLCSGEQTRRVFLEWEDVVPLRVSIYIYIYTYNVYS